MMKLFHFAACLALVLTTLGGVVPSPISAAQLQESPFDLADVPLPVAELPEPGFQILSGGYFDRDATITHISEPRNAATGGIDELMSDTGLIQTYVLNLVLLEDRAWVESDMLALVQTSVFLFTDEDGAEDGLEMLEDFSASSEAEEVEPAIVDASTIHLTSQSGDTYRSVFRRERVVVEVVSLESFRAVDLAMHGRTLGDTYDRLGDMQVVSSPGLASQAVLITDGARLADPVDAHESGVHQLYRVRGGSVQPAAGELRPPEVEEIAPGLTRLYQASQGVTIGQGTGFYSSWVGEFESEEAAASFMAGLPVSAPGAMLPDPYFSLWENEQSTSQGVSGLYRVSGSSESGAFSGTLEIQRLGVFVIGIGWRTLGNALPSVDVTSRLMDAQLTCLLDPRPCVPVPLEELLPPDWATPAAPVTSGEMVGSEEFGWTLMVDPDEWTITEQFVESGYDFVELQSGQSLVTFESVLNQHGDPQQCVLDEMHALQEFEEHAEISLGSDVAEEEPAGLATGHGWATYTVEPLADERADQEYTVRIDCYTLIEGAASLVMTHRAPRDAWEWERDKGETLRRSLQIPVPLAQDAILYRPCLDHWRCKMIDRIWIGHAA